MLSFHRISYCFLLICHVDHDLPLECDQKWLLLGQRRLWLSAAASNNYSSSSDTKVVPDHSKRVTPLLMLITYYYYVFATLCA